MRHPFLPLVVLLLAPAAYVGCRLGWHMRPAVRVAFAGAVVAVLIIAAVTGGMDFRDLNRVKLVLAAATTALVMWRGRGVGDAHATVLYRWALGIGAACGWMIYSNFLSFHATGPQRTYVHLHDVAHYYLGAKYAPEIGYMDLYTAVVRAAAEQDAARFTGRQARDLRTNRLVDVHALLEDSAPVKAHFTAERWAAFREDVGFFDQAMAQQFPDILLDHGYNPTPLWTLIGGVLANAIPAGSATGILLLTFIDPLLQVLLFLAVGWTFGLETALLSIIYFCILFGASFGWVGGAFLRSAWFFAVVIGVCCIQRRWFAAAGALFSFSAILRIFPGVYVFALVCKLAADALTTPRASPSLRRVLLSSLLAAAVLIAATASMPRGLATWLSFADNMQRHVENTAFNTIGLTQVLIHPVAFVVPPSTIAEELDQRRLIYLLQLATIAPLVLIWFVRRCRRESAVAATTMGIVLLFVGLNLACYYYLVMMLLIIANRDRPDRLALIFAVEAATYTLQLFEDRDAVLFFYRNVLVALLLVRLYAKPMHRTNGDPSVSGVHNSPADHLAADSR